MDPVRLTDARDAYLAHRKAQGLAVNTLRNDRVAIERLITHAGNHYVRSIQAHHIDEYLAHYTDIWAPGSMNLRANSLVQFFKFCRARRWMHRDFNPMENHRNRRVENVSRMRIPVGRFNEALDASLHPRDRMQVALGLFLFLRASEIRLLTLGDVYLERNEMAVKVPKSKLNDLMPISSPLRDELTRWLTYYTNEVGALRDAYHLIPAKLPCPGSYDAETQRLVPGMALAHLDPARPVGNPAATVKRVCLKLGYPDHKEGAHTLRRSGARALFDELADNGGYDRALEIVSTMLHHSSMGTTQHYLGLSESRLRRDELLKGRQMFSGMNPENVHRLHAVGSE